MKSAYKAYPVGIIRIDFENDCLCALNRVNEVASVNSVCDFSEIVFTQLDEYFNGTRKQFNVNFDLKGTDFQKKVWNALCEIPYGETWCYQDVAIHIGNPKACRAIGLANNKNPISIIVPCHRVIGKNGKLVGYGGGLDMKEQLLKLEKNNV